jgi:hypothetical protein
MATTATTAINSIIVKPRSRAAEPAILPIISG